MPKKFSFRELKMRSRAEKRRQSLRIAPVTKGFDTSDWQIVNYPVLTSLEAKVKAHDQSMKD